MAPAGPTSIAAVFAVTFSGLWGSFGPPLDSFVPKHVEVEQLQEEPFESGIEESQEKEQLEATECADSKPANATTKEAVGSNQVIDTPPFACCFLILAALVDGLLLLAGAVCCRQATSAELTGPAVADPIKREPATAPQTSPAEHSSDDVSAKVVEDLFEDCRESQSPLPLRADVSAESPAKPAQSQAAKLAMSPHGLAMTPQSLAMAHQCRKAIKPVARDRRRSVTFKLPESSSDEEYEQDQCMPSAEAKTESEDSEHQKLKSVEHPTVLPSSLGTVPEDGGPVQQPPHPSAPTPAEPKRLAPPKRLPRQPLKLQGTEQKLLKLGLQILHSHVKEAGTEMSTLTALPGGMCKILRKSFFEKLLSGGLQLRSMMASDVSAAQMDLRHLALEPLLELRVQSLDFATDSRSHEAHGNFLAALDRQLFEQLARRILKSYTGDKESLPKTDVLRRLGLRATLVLGAAEFLSRPKKAQNRTKIDQASLEDPREAELLQELETLMEEIKEEQRLQEEHEDASWRRFCRRCCWALPLEADDWPGHSLLLLCSPSGAYSSGWPEAKGLLGESSEEIALASAGGPVAVIKPASSRSSQSLHWEVKLMDPCCEDVLEQLAHARTEDAGVQQTKLAQELAAAVQIRGAAARLTALMMCEELPEDAEPEHVERRTETEGEIDEAAYRALKSAIKVVAAHGMSLEEVSEAQPEAYAAVQSAAKHAERCGLQFQDVYKKAQNFQETVLNPSGPASPKEMQETPNEAPLVPTPSRAGTARRARINRAMM